MGRENKINSLLGPLKHYQVGQSECCCLILQSMTQDGVEDQLPGSSLGTHSMGYKGVGEGWVVRE